MATTKDQVIAVTAAELRMGDGDVRTVVNAYERNRTALNRGKKKAPGGVKQVAKRRGGKPKHTGGGYYTVTAPNGDKYKVRGADNAADVYAGQVPGGLKPIAAK